MQDQSFFESILDPLTVRISANNVSRLHLSFSGSPSIGIRGIQIHSLSGMVSWDSTALSTLHTRQLQFDGFGGKSILGASTPRAGSTDCSRKSSTGGTVLETRRHAMLHVQISLGIPTIV